MWGKQYGSIKLSELKGKGEKPVNLRHGSMVSKKCDHTEKASGLTAP